MDLCLFLLSDAQIARDTFLCCKIKYKDFNLMEPDGTLLVKFKETKADILKTQQLRLFPEITIRWLEVIDTPCWL